MSGSQVQVEEVRGPSGLLALVIRNASPSETTFVTPAELNLQVGFVVYPDGGEVPRHKHEMLKRDIEGTNEVLVVREGACVTTIYDDEGNAVRELELAAGDVIVLISGGHGFRMLADTTFLEVKQGPYPGVDEKVRF